MAISYEYIGFCLVWNWGINHQMDPNGSFNKETDDKPLDFGFTILKQTQMS